MQEEIRIERWVMIVCGSGARWLGVPDHPPRIGDGIDRTPLDCSSPEGREAIVSDLATGNPILLGPAFEVLMLMSGDANGVQRSPHVCPVDLAAQGVRVYVRAESVYFLAELEGDDRRTYLKLIEQGYDVMRRARVVRAGLVGPR